MTPRIRAWIRGLGLGAALTGCNAVLGIDQEGELIQSDAGSSCEGTGACGGGGTGGLIGGGGRAASGGARASGGASPGAGGLASGGSADAGSGGSPTALAAGGAGGPDASDGAPADGSAPDAEAGGPCVDDATRCVEVGTPLRERCQAAEWHPTSPCSGTPPTECFEPACAGNGACTFEAKTPGTECSQGFCDARGQCVECLDVSTCPPPGDCEEAFCSAPGGECGVRQKDLGATCGPLGALRCNAAGACVDCLSHADCEIEEVCRSGACESAVEKIGSDAEGAGTESLAADVLYLIRLEPVPHDARLLAFGVVGTDNTAVRLALYADDGNGDASLPTGGAISEVAQPIDLIPGESETWPSPIRELRAGTRLWLGIVAQQATSIAGTDGQGVRAIRRAMSYADAFPENPAGVPHTSFAPSIYIKVLSRD